MSDTSFLPKRTGGVWQGLSAVFLALRDSSASTATNNSYEVNSCRQHHVRSGGRILSLILCESSFSGCASYIMVPLVDNYSSTTTTYCSWLHVVEKALDETARGYLKQLTLLRHRPHTHALSCIGFWRCWSWSWLWRTKNWLFIHPSISCITASRSECCLTLTSNNVLSCSLDNASS